MRITHVRVRLVDDEASKLKAFCSITIDDEFVVQDLKVIEGPPGLFVAMPSRKLAERCPECGTKNHLKANYCNKCGTKLREPGQSVFVEREALYADIAHPINSRCRERVERAVLDAFRRELAKTLDNGERTGRPSGSEPGESESGRKWDEHEGRFGEGLLPGDG